MSNAMVMESAVCRASSAGASCQPMPLTFLRRGDAAQVVRVKRRSRRRAIAMTDAAGRLRCRADPINRNRREDRKEEHG